MEMIVGTIILSDYKILMVKEAKKKCYGKWGFPAGHIEKYESVFEAAKRETLEETGCKVELRKTFPILVENDQNMNIIMIHFLADLIEDTFEYNTAEIIETRWISIEDLKNMKEEHLRSYTVVKKIIESIEKDKLYELEIINDVQNI